MIWYLIAFTTGFVAGYLYCVVRTVLKRDVVIFIYSNDERAKQIMKKLAS